MVRTLEQRGLETDNAIVLNNFVIHDLEDTATTALPADIPTPPDAYRIVFAGNMGHFQGLETFIRAARTLTDQKVHFLFLGQGAARSHLEELSRDQLGTSICFQDQVPIEQATSIIAQSDLGIVSLKPQVIAAAYPSKLMMYLEGGCRVLAVVEKESDLANLIRSGNLGSIAAPGNEEGIVEALAAEIALGRVGDDERLRIRAAAQNQFGRPHTLQAWVHLYRQLEDEIGS
jgi:glycosyltransferase involved in cell wall biosynthesis